MRTIAALALLAVAACGPPPAPAAPEPPELVTAAYAHYLRARVAAEEQDFATALVELERAADVAPDEAEIAAARIEVLVAAGRPAEAVQAAEAARARWPRSERVWRASGRALAAAGRAADAAEALERALGIDGGDEDAYLSLAEAWAQAGRGDRAGTTYRRLVRRFPDSAAGRLGLARALARQGRRAEAERELRVALRLRPELIEARTELADLLRAAGRGRDGTAALREAFERAGRDPALGRRLFFWLLDDGDAAAARALVGRIDGEDLEPGERAAAGELYLVVRAFEEARALAVAVLARAPEHAGARLLLARALAGLGQRAGAAKVLGELPDGVPGATAVRATEALLLARDGDLPAARARLAAARAIAPDDVDLAAADAEVREAAGADGDAFWAAELARRPREAALLLAAADHARRHGRAAHAIGLADAALALAPQALPALALAASTRADAGADLARAEALARLLVDELPDEALAVDLWGWVLLRRGRVSEAEPALTRAARLAPGDPEVRLHLAELYVRRGDPARARAALEAALAFDPEGPLRVRLQARLRALPPRPR